MVVYKGAKTIQWLWIMFSTNWTAGYAHVKEWSYIHKQRLTQNESCT